MHFIITSLLLVLTFTALNLISGNFADSSNLSDQPVLKFFLIYILAGIIYFIYAARYKDRKKPRNYLVWIFIVGIIARLLMIFSAPILEVDYFRYMWDGVVAVSGNSPYEYSPAELLEAKNKDLPESIRELSIIKHKVLEKINHPQLKTSYPPVTQAVFALSGFIKPFSLLTWKFVLLIADLLTVALIFLILKRLKLPESNLIIYWWNPLLIKEIFNSAHMDIIVFPFLLGCFLLYLSKRYVYAFAALAAAVGAKLWPVLIFPVLIRKFIPKWQEVIKYSIVFSVFNGILLFPLIFSYFDVGSGIEAYSRSWQNNDSIFRIILTLSKSVITMIGYHPGHGQYVSRMIIGLIVILSVLYINFNKAKDSTGYLKKALIIISLTFFLSPTQFPWYSLWMLPFLSIIPYNPLLLLSVLMPLYYLRYYYEPRGEYDFYYHYIVWLEYLPVLAWVAYDIVIKRCKRKKFNC